MQYLNLMLVDSRFPEILADVALMASWSGKLKLRELVEQLVRINHFNREYAQVFYQRKFYDFLKLLLYSNLNSRDVCHGKMDYSRIYCSKDSNGEVQFLNCYQQNILVECVLENCICKIKTEIRKSVVYKMSVKFEMPSQLKLP